MLRLPGGLKGTLTGGGVGLDPGGERLKLSSLARGGCAPLVLQLQPPGPVEGAIGGARLGAPATGIGVVGQGDVVVLGASSHVADGPSRRGMG